MPEPTTARVETTSRVSAAPLAELDRVAVDWVARALPLRLVVASTSEERDAVYRLRYQHVTRAGWAKPEELPDGKEHDRFDIGATHVVAWDGHTAVGTCRIVYPDADRALPPEEAFGLVIEPRGKAPTIDRLLVETSHRGGHATAALMARAWQELRRRGFELVSGIATREMIRLHRLMGFDVEVLGGPRLYWGEQRYAVLGAPSADLITASVDFEEVPAELSQILAHYGIDAASLARGARLVEDLGFDSLELVAVVLDIEEALGIERGELDGARTLGDVVDLVRLETGFARWRDGTSRGSERGTG